MDIKQLKFLIALDETRHFGQAAARCHITQPTLSMRLRNLEEELDLPLVNRGQLAAKDFVEREGGAVLLDGDARKAVVVAYQERKKEELTHALLAETVPLGLVPLVQARLLARHVRGESPAYVPFASR